ncbi:hypothetical protein My1_075 [Pectobacterium phage My1]|uniref:Uncharacterized protein n=1 Tax=Pectobacterium phage My1 TaxID=1204539 RepID=J9QKZ3_9CAUD|nr:hypothetical protein My1_075 [Pectobacterium phage My1]AFQ22234.1 hypothetical protein My1_075 [Pectobacterium phage My1]
MSDLKALQDEISKLVLRLSQLRHLKGAISGNTQISFTLTASYANTKATFDIAEIGRDYLNRVKPEYDMVKLGLLKGLEREIDNTKDKLKTCYLEEADLLQKQCDNAIINANKLRK